MHSRLLKTSYAAHLTFRVQGYERLGIHVNDDNSITYREWAPNALRAYFIGDFSTPIGCVTLIQNTDKSTRRLEPRFA